MNPQTRLREQYAKERTLLAIDRTILSYIRTSMTIVVVGVTFIKFFDNVRMQQTGVGLIIVAIILTGVGIVRSAQIRKKIYEYTQQTIS